MTTLNRPLDALKELLAGSSNFQTWAGATNSTEAEARVFTNQAGPMTAGDAVRVILSRKKHNRPKKSESIGFLDKGQIKAQFQAPVATTRYAFDATLSGVLDDLEANDDSLGYFEIEGFDIDETTAISDRDERDANDDRLNYYQATVLVSWRGY